MQQQKQPVPQYYFSPGEWDRLGCGPLPAERNRDLQPVQGQQQKNMIWIGSWMKISNNLCERIAQ